MQIWQYCLLVTARSLYMFRTLSASIIRSTKNCSSSYWCMSCVGMIYPVRTSKVGSLLHYVIAYLGLQDHSTCFGRFLRPSSGVLKTVVAATGACHRTGRYISIKDVQGQLPTALCYSLFRTGWLVVSIDGCCVVYHIPHSN